MGASRLRIISRHILPNIISPIVIKATLDMGDAIAQTLVSRKWSKLLLLVGASAQDQQRAATAQASIKRYGLQVVATKPFKLVAVALANKLARMAFAIMISDQRYRGAPA